jgi:hypothetical protein
MVLVIFKNSNKLYAMKKKGSLIFCLFFIILGYSQQNYKEWLKVSNEGYANWSIKQNWKLQYFKWKQNADADYKNWLKENDWDIEFKDEEGFNIDTVTSGSVLNNIDSVIRFTNNTSNLLSFSENQIAKLQKDSVKLSQSKKEEIFKLKEQIRDLKKRNKKLKEQENLTLPKIKIWAVIVGISEYQKEESKLRYCDDDAYKIYGFLRSLEGGALPEGQIKLLIDEDASGVKIKNALNNFTKKAGPDDIFLFYYSGHGSPNNLLAKDYSETSQGLISHQFIKDKLYESKAKFTYCILDACHSGNIMSGLNKGIISNKSVKDLETSALFYNSLSNIEKGNVFIVSSKGKEISMEVSGKRQGVFSYYFIEALKGKADYNNDQVISITEAFNYTRENVIKYTNKKQTPLISGEYLHTMPISFVRN